MKGQLIYLESTSSKNSYAIIYLTKININNIENSIIDILRKVNLISSFKKFKFSILKSREDAILNEHFNDALTTFIYYDTLSKLWKMRVSMIPDINILNILDPKLTLRIRRFVFDRSSGLSNLMEKDKSFFSNLLHIDHTDSTCFFMSNNDDFHIMKNIINSEVHKNQTEIFIIDVEKFFEYFDEFFNNIYNIKSENMQFYLYNKQDMSYRLITGSKDRLIIQKV